MTPGRARAYGRLIAALERLGPARLHADEAARLREAADTLLFLADPADPDPGRRAMAEARELLDGLVAAERLEPVTAGELELALAGVGPIDETAVAGLRG